MSERRYTRDEVNELLPDLTAQIVRIREAREVMIAAAARIERRVSEDGGGVAESAWFEASAVLRREIEDLAARAVILRDPTAGLVDFPAQIDGQSAFLCWVVGEPTVGYWHPLDTGFAGRRPL